MNKNQKGFVYIPILLILVLVSLAGTVLLIKQSEFQKLTNLQSTPTEIPTPTVTPLSRPYITVSPTNLPTSKPTPKPTPKPTSLPTPTNPPNPSPKDRCEIVIYAFSPDEPLRLNLASSLYVTGDKYMAGAQWDFDGDGNWDTDFSQSNGRISHTFPKSGNYNIRLHLKISDGTMTDICTKNINLPLSQSAGMSISVRLTGQVFRDANCSNMKDVGEEGIPRVTINLIKLPEYILYDTLTTDSNGNYSFSGVIGSEEVLSLEVGYGYPLGYTRPASFGKKIANLNKNQSSIVFDLPQVPVENLNLCSY